MNREENRIRPLTGGSGSDFTVTFSSNEVTAIDEMLGIFGDSREGIIFKAVSLLYTIYQEDSQAEAVYLQRGNNKRTVIPLK